MKRKEYQKPMMEVIEADVESQILAASHYETTGTGGTSIEAMEDPEDLTPASTSRAFSAFGEDLWD